MHDPLRDLRLKILDVAHHAKGGHVPSALSILELVYSVYQFRNNHDHFVLSKGHGCLALYAVLWDLGIIGTETFDSFNQFHSLLGGHPDCTKHPSIEFSTGSLGHGFPMAVGLALGLKATGRSDQRVYCLVGDGEFNEGTCWEAALLSVRFRLDNLCLIVDRNHSERMGLDIGDVANRMLQQGWWVCTCNGHDLDSIKQAFSPFPTGQPLLVVADTVKGYGIPSMEEHPNVWHHRVISDEDYKNLLNDMVPPVIPT